MSNLQLAVGSTGSLSWLKSRWLKLNHESGYQVQVSQNIAKPKARYFSVCFSSPKTGWKLDGDHCKAHVRASGENQDIMKITSIDINHTCGVDQRRRKRNYLTRDIADVSDLVGIYEPTTSKEGNTKQFIQMTKKATGMSLKKGQATLAIRQKCNDSMEALIGQYMLLPSLFWAYSFTDPFGSYIIEDSPCPWNQELKQFTRCYICLSIAKRFWSNDGIRLVLCDGTFNKTRGFRHIILIACTFDGNNQVIILAFAIVDTENADNWVWFKECLDGDFPGYAVWMSDADKGITSNAFALSMSQSDGSTEFVLSRCARHLAENCREACTGRMNEEHKSMIINLAKSRTEDIYNKRLEAIRSINEQWANYLHDKRSQFVSAFFLEEGISRCGKVTSNGVKNVNGALTGSRTLPILDMIEDMVKYQVDKYSERKEQAKKWVSMNKCLTAFAEAEERKMGTIASTRNVHILESNHPFYKAKVSVTTLNAYNSNHTGYIEVSVDCSRYRFHLNTYSACYGADVPGMCVTGKLKADEMYIAHQTTNALLVVPVRKERIARIWLPPTPNEIAKPVERWAILPSLARIPRPNTDTTSTRLELWPGANNVNLLLLRRTNSFLL